MSDKGVSVDPFEVSTSFSVRSSRMPARESRSFSTFSANSDAAAAFEPEIHLHLDRAAQRVDDFDRFSAGPRTSSLGEMGGKYMSPRSRRKRRSTPTQPLHGYVAPPLTSFTRALWTGRSKPPHRLAEREENGLSGWPKAASIVAIATCAETAPSGPAEAQDA